jgi:hypothetical protein
MGKILSKCGDEVTQMADKLLGSTHRDVAELDPDIGYYFIEYDSDTKEAAAKKHRELPPVLKLHGAACAATIKINSYKDRVQGKPDVTVTISREAWDEFTDAQRLALLDHELTHLLVKWEKKTNAPMADDLGRPTFAMRPHDYDLSIFGEVVRRHGKAAVEVKTTVHFLTSEDGQMLMDFGGLKCLPSIAKHAADNIPADWQDRNAPGFPGEKLVDIAAKMYQARSVCKSWGGERYPQQITPWMEKVNAAAKKAGHDNYCSAALDVMRTCKTVGEQIWALAAAMEIAEPSFKHRDPDLVPLKDAMGKPER